MSIYNLNNNLTKNYSKKTAFSLIELSVVVLIIGILIAGITAGSRLVRNSKLASAAQFTKSSDVNSIPDLVLWLEPTQENSFAATSANTDTLTYANVAGLQDSAYVKDTLRPDNRQYIARWNDISPRAVPGNKKSVYQETGSRRPMYIANAINGLPALEFNNFQYLYSQNNNTTPSAPPLVAGDKSATYIVVFSSSNSLESGHRTILDQFVGFSNNSIDGAEFGVAVGKNNNNLAIATWIPDIEDLGQIIQMQPNIAITTLEDKIIQSSNNLTYCLNKLNCTKTNYETSGLNLSNNTFAVAARAFSGDYTASDRKFTGYIGEVMVFDRALKAEEIDTINKYLSKKWGIALK